MVTDETFVIAGAGLAGAKAAEMLRAEGFDGRVVLLGEEAHLPYERPPLSKAYLRGEAARQELDVHGADFYEANGIELRRGCAATAVDPAASEIVLAGDERLRYDRLLLATGSEPRRLRLPGSELDGIHSLRTAGDADALRARLDAGGTLVVIGAGWIGAEVAASVRTRGLDVTVVEPQSVPLERVLGQEVGGVYRDIYADHGVTLLLGTGVEAFEGSSSVERVRITGGRVLDCDGVVVGVGVVPRVALAGRAGLASDGGLAVDARLQTTVPGVYAAGDVASVDHPFYGERVRVEHWANALEQGPAAARSMLGAGDAFTRIPYFFSGQYDVGMEYASAAADASSAVLVRSGSIVAS